MAAGAGAGAKGPGAGAKCPSTGQRSAPERGEVWPPPLAPFARLIAKRGGLEGGRSVGGWQKKPSEARASLFFASDQATGALKPVARSNEAGAGGREPFLKACRLPCPFDTLKFRKKDPHLQLARRGHGVTYIARIRPIIHALYRICNFYQLSFPYRPLEDTRDNDQNTHTCRKS